MPRTKKAAKPKTLPQLLEEEGEALVAITATFRRLERQVDLLEGILRGQQDLADGKTLSHAEVMARLAERKGPVPNSETRTAMAEAEALVQGRSASFGEGRGEEGAYHVLFDQEPGDTGVVVIGKDPSGVSYGPTHGATLAEALRRLRVGARAVMASMADDGEFPLAILGRGRSEHIDANFTPEELIPIVRRYLHGPKKRAPKKSRKRYTLVELLEGVDREALEALNAQVAPAMAGPPIGREVFSLNAEQWEAFQKVLESPPRPMPRMKALLNTPSIFDSDVEGPPTKPSKAKKTQTRPYDAADNLKTEERWAAYLEAALEDGHPEVIAAARAAIARSRAKSLPHDEAWMNADLSSLGAIEPYDWKGADPLTLGRPVVHRPDGSFVVEDAEEGDPGVREAVQRAQNVAAPYVEDLPSLADSLSADRRAEALQETQEILEDKVFSARLKKSIQQAKDGRTKSLKEVRERLLGKERDALLQLLALGEQEVREGETKPLKEALKEVRERVSLKKPGPAPKPTRLKGTGPTAADQVLQDREDWERIREILKSIDPNWSGKKPIDREPIDIGPKGRAAVKRFFEKERGRGAELKALGADPLAALRKEFDRRVALMQTPPSKAAVTALFAATPEELGRAAVEGFKASHDLKPFPELAELLEQTLRLSPQDQAAFAEALLNPPPIAPALGRARTRRAALLSMVEQDRLAQGEVIRPGTELGETFLKALDLPDLKIPYTILSKRPVCLASETPGPLFLATGRGSSLKKAEADLRGAILMALECLGEKGIDWITPVKDLPNGDGYLTFTPAEYLPLLARSNRRASFIQAVEEANRLLGPALQELAKGPKKKKQKVRPVEEGPEPTRAEKVEKAGKRVNATFGPVFKKLAKR